MSAAEVASDGSAPSGRAAAARRVEECRALFARAAALAAHLTPAQLAWTAPALGYGGVGAQLRHVVVFADELANGARIGRVDYDARARDLAWECDGAAIARALGRAARRLATLAALDEDAPLAVRQDEPGARGCARGGFTRSSVGRELRALASHTVHHLAVVELLLHAQGVAGAPSRGLGIAPSTPRRGARAR